MMVGRVLILLLFTGSSFAQNNRITISESYIKSEFKVREDALGRKLGQDEKQDVIKLLIENEVLINEAIKLKLHYSDNEVRERLVSIMEYILQPRVPDPAEIDLKNFYEDNKALFNTPIEYSFNHIFFETKPTIGIDELNAESNWLELGDKHWIGSVLNNKPKSEILVFMGIDLATVIENADLNKWYGPLKSPIGYHFVEIFDRTSTVERGFEEVKDIVYSEYMSRLRKSLFEEQIQQTIDNYEIIIPEIYP